MNAILIWNAIWFAPFAIVGAGMMFERIENAILDRRTDRRWAKR